MKFLINFLISKVPIKRRLFLIFLVPVIAYYLVSTIASFSHIQNVSTARLEQLQVVVESAVVKTASQLLSRGIKHELEEVIKSLIVSTDVTGLVVYDIDGSVFAQAGNITPHSEIPTFKKDIYHTPVTPNFNEISFDGGVDIGKPVLIGQLVFQVGHETIFGNSWKAVLGDSFLFLFILLIFSPFFYALYKSFRDPLSSILNDILEFEKGNFEWTQRTSIGTDELTRVAHALQQLANTQIDQSQQLTEARYSLESRAKELEKQVLIITEARESADRANSQKNTFVANISHEMRTPLAGVVSGIELIEDYVTDALVEIMESKDQTTPEQFIVRRAIAAELKKTLFGIDVAKQSSGQLTRMVTDLLSSIQDMYHEIILQPSTFILYDSVDVLFRSHKEQALEKGLEYSWSIVGIDTNDSVYVKGDWIRICQVLNNLVSNAIRFTERGKVTIKANISTTDTGIDLYFTISDTGVGIVDHEKESIFKLFHIGENPQDKKYAGLGTGLTISQRIGQRMKGDINLECSELGVGSRFSFRIELPSSTAEEMIPRDAKALSGRRVSLLYVEDSPLNRTIFKMYCEKMGIDLLMAENGQKGIERFDSHRFDALVVDCHMPGINGYDFVKHIRAKEKEEDSGRVPIFALTADASTRNRERCFESGFDEFLTKPYTGASFNFILDRIDRLTLARRGHIETHDFLD